jgi:hypothetical protein
VGRNNDAEFRQVIEELRQALRDHYKRLKVLAHAKIRGGITFSRAASIRARLIT